MLELEIPICHMLARTVKRRLAIVQCGTIAVTIEAGDVEPGMTVLYMTI